MITQSYLLEISAHQKRFYNRDLKDCEIFCIPSVRLASRLICQCLFSGRNSTLIVLGSPAYSVATNLSVYFSKTIYLSFDEIELLALMQYDGDTIVYLNSPLNPTGQEIDCHDLKFIVDTCSKKGAWILYNAVYEPLSSHTKAFDLQYDKLIYLFSFSKSFPLASFRIGYCINRVKLFELMHEFYNEHTLRTSDASQKCAAYWLSRDQIYVDRISQTIVKNREMITSTLCTNGIPYIQPTGGYIMTITPPKEISMKFENNLSQKNVATFNADNYFSDHPFTRISYACSSEVIASALPKIVNAYEEAKS